MIEITKDGKQFRLTQATSREQLATWAENRNRECVYATHTCWWSLFETVWMPYTTDGQRGGIPCDPRGSVLMQGDLWKFWEHANDYARDYGSHGIDALVLAFHGNLEVLKDGRYLPTSLNGWAAYNELLDMVG